MAKYSLQRQAGFVSWSGGIRNKSKKESGWKEKLQSMLDAQCLNYEQGSIRKLSPLIWNFVVLFRGNTEITFHLLFVFWRLFFNVQEYYKKECYLLVIFFLMCMIPVCVCFSWRTTTLCSSSWGMCWQRLSAVFLGILFSCDWSLFWLYPTWNRPLSYYCSWSCLVFLVAVLLSVVRLFDYYTYRLGFVRKEFTDIVLARLLW